MMTPRLVGVGVGPGDPELITVKAVRVLAEAGAVLVPVMGGSGTSGMGPAEPGRAEAIVRAHIDGERIHRVPFALNDRGGVTQGRRAAWEAAAGEVAAAFAAGAGTVAFATIGDPNLYSTFSYLAQAVRAVVPDVIIETVPGITAMQDLAARSGTVLAEGAESLVLLALARQPRGESGHRGLGSPRAAQRHPGPAPSPAGFLRETLRDHDTVVAYKLGAAGGDMAALLAALEDAGRLGDAVYGARLGLPGEDIRPVAEVTGPVPYLSTLIAPGRRGGIGSKLR